MLVTSRCSLSGGQHALRLSAGRSGSDCACVFLIRDQAGLHEGRKLVLHVRIGVVCMCVDGQENVSLAGRGPFHISQTQSPPLCVWEGMRLNVKEFFFFFIRVREPSEALAGDSTHDWQWPSHLLEDKFNSKQQRQPACLCLCPGVVVRLIYFCNSKKYKSLCGKQKISFKQKTTNRKKWRPHTAAVHDFFSFFFWLTTDALEMIISCYMRPSTLNCSGVLQWCVKRKSSHRKSGQSQWILSI